MKSEHLTTGTPGAQAQGGAGGTPASTPLEPSPIPAALREYADALDKDRGHSKSAVTRLMREAAEEIEDLQSALSLVDEPYPIEVFPALKDPDAVFAAMRSVNKYATEQFWAECARQRGEVARSHLAKWRADRGN